MEENGKAKMSLERSISKNRRELAQIEDRLVQTRKELDAGEHEVVKLNASLEQPTEVIFIEPVRVIDLDDEPLPSQGDAVAAGDLGFLPLAFPEGLLPAVRKFIGGTPLTLLNEEVDAAYIFMAAFAVLLRHASGSETFVIGLDAHMRPHEESSELPAVGPWSKLIPLKVDTANADLLLTDLGEKLKRSTMDGETVTFGMSRLQWNDELQRLGFLASTADFYLPAHFQYIASAEWHALQELGLSFDDILPTTTTTTAIGEDVTFPPAQRLWANDTEEPFDLRLVLMEDGNRLCGGFYYRKSAVHADKVAKWAERYLNVLSNVEDGSRLSISALIGRFYRQVWTSSSTVLVDAQ